MKKHVLIENWKLEYGDHTIYTAPELITVHLYGLVTNHPKLGKDWIRSSAIVFVKGKVVKTKSGTIYKLGGIDLGYKNWIQENYPNWDENNPIKVKGA